MSRPGGVQFDPTALSALASHLNAPHFGVQYPIRLTAQDPYLSGRAALVFVSAHGLSPADDNAHFGEWVLDDVYGYHFVPPHDEARLVAWFRPPEVDRKYNIDFSIVASSGSYSLASGDGTETTDVPGPLSVEWDKELSTTFQAHSNDWRSFTLSGTSYWQLNYCEINLLP
jgi:hypothetical protein